MYRLSMTATNIIEQLDEASLRRRLIELEAERDAVFVLLQAAVRRNRTRSKPKVKAVRRGK